MTDWNTHTSKRILIIIDNEGSESKIMGTGSLRSNYQEGNHL